MRDWVIGILFAVASCLMSNIGIQIQKVAHTRIAVLKAQRELEEHVVACRLEGNYLFHPLWIFGLVIQGIGNLLDVMALSYAPQSIIGPVGMYIFIFRNQPH